MGKEWKKPSLTVDAIVLDRKGCLLLVERGKDPFLGSYALPGGFVEYGETLEVAVARELEEETGIIGKVLNLVGVYSEPDRDPRGHTVSVVYQLGIVGGDLRAGDDAAKASFFPIDDLPPLAFDHDRIISEFYSKMK